MARPVSHNLDFLRNPVSPYSDSRPDSSSSGNDTRALPSKDASRLRQIVNHFFTKAALTIVSSRTPIPTSFYRDSDKRRSDRWFNLILDESETLSKQLVQWADSDPLADEVDPLIIEIYLDTSELANNQTLAVIDERGRKWDACEALSSPAGSNSGPKSRRGKHAHVILERWKISLDRQATSNQTSSSDTMPNVYKKAVVLFRSLFTYSRLLPAWDFCQQLAHQPATLTSLRPNYRILNAQSSRPSSGTSKDSLTAPLYPSADPVTTSHQFDQVHSLSGGLNIEVSYRNNCNFCTDDAEALISSQFTGLDNQYFRPSLGDTSGQDMSYLRTGKEIGSLPADRHRFANQQDPRQAYGSLSTYHAAGARMGTSPLTTLRVAGEEQSVSPRDTPPSKALPNHRSSQSSKSSLKTGESAPPGQRRVSVSFQPFKAGSLSSSPGPSTTNVPPSPGTSVPRSPGLPGHAPPARGSRISLSAIPQGKSGSPGSVPNDIAVATPSSGSSVKPPSVSRYSSSFSHRRSRLSSGGASAKTEEDNESSGKASQTSSNQPGSGMLAEPEGSSGSVQTDDDNITDFLRLLEQKKDLKSFNRNDDASKDASGKKTAAQLSKFQRLRDSHAALGESMSSSMMMQRSSDSSRQLSSVPPGLAGASVSTSSSPGKPLSPHTPHTPAVPSRLSTNTTAMSQSDARSRSQTGGSSSPEQSRQNTRSGRTDTPRSEGGTIAIDIPTSPQRYPHVRRPSSLTQHQRALDDDMEMRSASVPSEERPDLSLSELLTLHEPLRAAHPGGIQADDEAESPSPRTISVPQPSTNQLSARSRYNRGVSNRGSGSSLGTGAGSSERFGRTSMGSRPTASNNDDEEPLLFTLNMSEAGSQSRKSLEDNNNANQSYEGSLGSGTGRHVGRNR